MEVTKWKELDLEVLVGPLYLYHLDNSTHAWPWLGLEPRARRHVQMGSKMGRVNKEIINYTLVQLIIHLYLRATYLRWFRLVASILASKQIVAKKGKSAFYSFTKILATKLLLKWWIWWAPWSESSKSELPKSNS